MDNQLPSAAPDIGNILKFAALLWRAKWLIGATTIFAIAMTFALYRPTTAQAWTGRTTLTIGLAPPTNYALTGFGPPLLPIEIPRNAVARISDPAFRTKVANQSAFEPATAAFSRAMVASSLRGIAQEENDRDVTIELTAGSAADVQAAFSALATEISKEHGDLVNRQLQLLRARIAEAKSRIALIENSTETLNNHIFRSDSDKSAQQSPALSTSNLAALVPAWNELQDRIQDDINVTQFSEPSVLHMDSNTLTLESRSLGTLKASILAGFIMLVAMIVLTVVVGRSARASVD